MKMTEIMEFGGRLNVLGSGLRIGGAKESVGIGETDKPIIRHPITHLPYVPGSSVKGKIRSLLELRHSADTQKTGKPCTCGRCLVCQLFGCGESRQIRSPSRLVFRDAQPSESTRQVWQESGVSSELKTEVLIDRNKGLSYGSIGPRTMERIPAGSDFDFSFSLRLFEGDPVADYLEFLAEGFELLARHYLGGSGSRGYGEVLVVAENGQPMQDYLRQQARQLTGQGAAGG